MKCCWLVDKGDRISDISMSLGWCVLRWGFVRHCTRYCTSLCYTWGPLDDDKAPFAQQDWNRNGNYITIQTR